MGQETPRETFEALGRDFERFSERLPQLVADLWNRTLDTPWSTWAKIGALILAVLALPGVARWIGEKARERKRKRRALERRQELQRQEDERAAAAARRSTQAKPRF